ncbi:MAG: LysM peptidoglycan-binding domain-containing protein [Lachnospiraceae bacterium]|nr:LysM peptidoglycan-binding domain-containing protein [Lachnospiraceae bacterium]
MKTAEKRQESRIVFAVISLLLLAGLMCTMSLCIHSTVDAAEKNRYKYYTHILVEKGDSLWDIAGQYVSYEYDSRSQYIEELCSINHLSSQTIYAGEMLVIPYYDEEYK